MENRFGLPKTDYFTVNSNYYTGSLLPFNYRFDATGEEIVVTVWYGLLCMARSTPVDQKEFAKDAAGYDAAVAWLEEQYQLCLQKTKDSANESARAFSASCTEAGAPTEKTDQ